MPFWGVIIEIPRYKRYLGMKSVSKIVRHSRTVLAKTASIPQTVADGE
jgi:hypothetical protein